MVLGFYKVYGEIYGGVYDDFEQFYRSTFFPESEVLFLWDMKSHGKSYEERKSYIQDMAIDYSNTEKPDLYMSEYITIQNVFETHGKRYGLLKEFKENCIC